MKSIFTIVLSLLMFGIHAQTIPNGDFENWEIRDHFKLDGWFSPSQNVERTTDAKVGKYALKLSNTYSASSNGTKGYVRNLDYSNRKALNGFAFGGEALSLSFWSKHDLAAGDTARIYIVFREKGTYRGKVDFRFTGSTNNEFVNYKVPLEWNGIKSCDTAWLYLYSYIKNKVEGDGYVIFDDVHFENIGERLPDITNADFENWTNVGVEFPSTWRSIDLRQYDRYTSFLSSQSTFKLSGDLAHTGEYSLMVKNYQSGTSARYGYAYIGTEDNDYYTRSFPVSDSFHYLQGYYKYIPDGEDTARVQYRTWEGSRSRSNDYISLTEAQEWTFFAMPIDYYANESLPDSAAIMIYSSFNDTIRGFNSALHLDNLELVMEPTPLTLGVKEIAHKVKFYPNPTEKKVHISTEVYFDACIVRDVLGQIVLSSSHTKDLDVSNLKNGIYYLTVLSGSEAIANHKIIKIAGI
ncbi:T9SS type A sorting domain-containing protein [Bacteroidia bacterium]|nr:T9SS type A sorting domain-containing protein [Bacteroidia bacterium]MDB9882520.1 T9SS type A sorting domain-containing protein [Bacteroidia bacterium]